ncbi:MAG: NADPH-dependent 7-cyano-7-deazaguanine reductase QueF [Candidatus Saccharibacteria bacterium]|nr:NADPH-dependent 7-cyano-7-deazaguanine reductase QueF [Moraxellaceae bacterium]
MSVHDSALGQATDYPTQYDPSILFPIARSEGRAALGVSAPDAIKMGVDVWHVFELSWFDEIGKPMVAIGRLTVPAHSPFLIESKSLKLYFNSLNFKQFANETALIELVVQDLSEAAGAHIEFELLNVDDLVTHLPQGLCLDALNMTVSPAPNVPNAQLLKIETQLSVDVVEETLYSNLLRSNCPVTGQPDWGTVFIRYRGAKLCNASLLTYLISYRQHSGFHEQCVEQIFADIWQFLKPESLAVHAQYTRRGGLDINPCRSSNPLWLPTVKRLARQ